MSNHKTHQGQQQSLQELENLGLVLTTQAQGLMEKWRRSHFSTSFIPLNLGSGCCALEMMHASLGPQVPVAFDEFCVRRPPEESDLLIVSGAITHKMVPILKTLYNQMLEPKWVMAVGTCAMSGAVFPSYSTINGLEKILPVDIVIPGCPPTPEALKAGIGLLQERINSGVERQMR